MRGSEASAGAGKIGREAISARSSVFLRGGGAWILHGALLLATFLTTTGFGSALAVAFRAQQRLSTDVVFSSYSRLIHLDRDLWSGLSFSVPLLAILIAHELGHYLEARRQRVNASLPYFLPSPFMFGTFGAFIRIRSPIYSRTALFDIGIRGPLAGFCMLVPFLVLGVTLSKITPSVPASDDVLFGAPLALSLLEQLRFPGTPPSQILLHPTAMAAWVGLFATALNLLPIGQLDGGHIVYAIGAARWHRRIGFAFVLLLVVAGWWYRPWWLWALVMFFFGRRHVLIYDATPLAPSRLWSAAIAAAILILSVTIVPMPGF